MKSWQSKRFSAVLIRSKERETELAGLFRQPIPQNDNELEYFVVEKRKLDTKISTIIHVSATYRYLT